MDANPEGSAISNFSNHRVPHFASTSIGSRKDKLLCYARKMKQITIFQTNHWRL